MKERGVSLIELMISITVGMIVIAGTLALVSSTFGTSIYQLRTSVLNNELRQAMNTIAADLRRTSYINWTDAQFTSGGFTGQTPSERNVSIASGILQTGYDLNNNGAIDSNETFAFQLSQTGALQQKIGNGNWSNLTDPSVVTISEFKLEDFSQDLAAPGATGSVTMPIFTITITGNLSQDATTQRTITETIYGRNPIVN